MTQMPDCEQLPVSLLDWFCVEGDVDDFIFYDEDGCPSEK